MLEPTRGRSTEVTLVASEHDRIADDLLRTVSENRTTGQSLQAWRTRVVKGNPWFGTRDAREVLFLSGGRAIGYCGSSPAEVWCAGKAYQADWIKHLHVVPEHRKGPIGFIVLRKMLRHTPCPLALVVSTPARRLFEGLGMIQIGALSNYLCLLNPSAVVNRIDLQRLGGSRMTGWISGVVRLAQRTGLASAFGACVGAAMRTKAVLRSPYAKFLSVETDAGLPEKDEIDLLWQMARTRIAAAPVRDGRYLLWRYGQASLYSAVIVRRKSELVGLAIVRRPCEQLDPRLNGLRITVLSDILFSPDHVDVGWAALEGAESLARGQGADALLCSASHGLLRSILSARPYVRTPASVHFMVLGEKLVAPFSKHLSSWWLTRGDADSDDSF